MLQVPLTPSSQNPPTGAAGSDTTHMHEKRSDLKSKSLNWPNSELIIHSVSTGGSAAGRRLVAQGLMSAVVVVVVFPVADDDPGLGR
jgi:hypothetical protein